MRVHLVSLTSVHLQAKDYLDSDCGVMTLAKKATPQLMLINI